jgi:ABC-type glycerol-3-phosphate transport system substrate-binding protein
MKKSSAIAALMVFCAIVLVAVGSQAQKPEATEIHWLTDMGTALQRAKSENKPILLDFFNPN